MIQIKKTILTLVALLAVTTGAWAQSTLDVVELGVPAEWATDNSNMTAADLPGFKASTLDEAKAWTGAPKTVVVYLIYAFNGEGFNYVSFEKGKYTGDNFQPLPKNSFFGPSDVKFYYTTGSAIAVEVTSGPKVAWNKTSNTGTFTMPGGNVTLEPEYYPQAALTAAPTAINNVPATTDGAIVNAGTVANIGSTETAQGTVMYYVSQTALDDAALLALAADKWTADVPTAEKLTKGEAYVYYYVRGNDSDNDEENFSDGDIKAANALTVTIAAAPTYAVTFAEGVNPEPPAEPEWTASPNAGVKKGETVTVTYTGSKKVIGVKAEKKAKAPTTVTWSPVYFEGTTYTQDGVTLTPSSGDGAFSNALYDYGDNTFTTTLGKFTKIEIVCTGNNLDGWTKETAGKFQPNPDGDPEYWKDLFKMTWTGNAESVTLKEKYVYEIQSITFTIQ